MSVRIGTFEKTHKFNTKHTKEHKKNTNKHIVEQLTMITSNKNNNNNNNNNKAAIAKHNSMTHDL